MVLPVYLAMTGAELAGYPVPSFPVAWMACQFSPYSQGLTNIPDQLPPGSLVMVSDYFPCQGHSPALVAEQLRDALSRLDCAGLLLDFQRPRDEETAALVRCILQGLPCPGAVTAAYSDDSKGPVILSPAPLHVPLAEYLSPWQGRELWLEAALCQEQALVTEAGCAFTPQFPPEGRAGGFFDESLCCCYETSQTPDRIVFTLYDTRESLNQKLELAQKLGVTQAVGLYQELG